MKNKSKGKSEISFTQGSIAGALIRFSLPVLGALILQAAYGAVDLMVVGMFCDPASISAVGTGSTFMSMITFIITSLAMGSTVTIARHIGEKKPEAAGKTVGTTIILFLLIGIVLTAALELSIMPVIEILQVPADSVFKAMDYLRICSAGILVIIAYNIIACILRGAGNANLPLLFVAIACAVNIVADFVFVGVFHMDVAGAAWATVLAQLVSVVVSLPILMKKDLGFHFAKKDLRIYKNEMRQILQIGIPISLQEFTVQISFLVINAIVNGMGLLPSAGYGVSQKVTAFIMLVPSALMQSVSAYVAQNIGANQAARARKGLKIAIAGGTAIGILMFLLGFFKADWLSSFFTSDLGVIAQSSDYIRGFCFDCVLTCTLFSFIGYFNGCSRSTPVMVQGIVSALFLRIPLTMYFASLPNTNLFLVGISAPITTVFGILFFLVCYIWIGRKNRKQVSQSLSAL
ncbi:MATE family efflux transporter [Allobaculum mucilyticum]|uniref:MATE family efflux transporter n=1 Tax=Allobaculum mucilyticum TaxID=2834459 RepID=UPI001E5AEE4D|nr:MATE family efflux transporter [Allobaculum mucilyticum]UNT95609.1 MATE family efflux transporter [Allobaculum mucilyticum]